MLQPLLKRRFEERTPNRWGNLSLDIRIHYRLFLDVSVINPSCYCYANDDNSGDNDVLDRNWFRWWRRRWCCRRSKGNTDIPVPIKDLGEVVCYSRVGDDNSRFSVFVSGFVAPVDTPLCFEDIYNRSEVCVNLETGEYAWNLPDFGTYYGVGNVTYHGPIATITSPPGYPATLSLRVYATGLAYGTLIYRPARLRSSLYANGEMEVCP